ANHTPTANAGPDQTVTATAAGSAQVRLDGSASRDPDGDPLTFTWTGDFGMAGGAVVTPTLGVGTHTVVLTVQDGRGGSASDSVIITVSAPPPACVVCAGIPGPSGPPGPEGPAGATGAQGPAAAKG